MQECKAMLETELDFWKEPAPGRRADILVSEENMSSVRKFLDTLGTNRVLVG